MPKVEPTASFNGVSPSWKSVAKLADIVQIFEPGVQVCSFKRSLDPRIATYIARCKNLDPFQITETGYPGVSLELDSLPVETGRAKLIEDLNFLKDIVHDLLGCPETGLRLAYLDHAMCPGWHFDKTGIRLVCTFWGAGTEWLHDQDKASYARNTNGRIAYQQAAEGEIVLLKGSLWQGNESFGAIHRSPDVKPEAGLRLVVTIDPLWP